MKLPSLDTISKESAFANTNWQLQPHRNGLLKVGAGRERQPYEFCWEVHGEGPIKVVVGAMLIPPNRSTVDDGLPLHRNCGAHVSND